MSNEFRVPQIGVSQEKVRDVGSCNACVMEWPYEGLETITLIDLRGLSFRLCDRCKEELLRLLK